MSRPTNISRLSPQKVSWSESRIDLLNLLGLRAKARLTLTDQLTQDLSEVESAELARNRATEDHAEVSARRERLAS